MKCTKLIYASPLFGSVNCEELFQDDDGCIELDASATRIMFLNFPGFESFLEKKKEDLVEHVPVELKNVVVKAEFGNYYVEDEQVSLLTEIYVRRELTPEEGNIIEMWIEGQLSDGWGESFEQEEVNEDRLRWTQPVFDPDYCEFEDVECYADVYYYLTPWCSYRGWRLRLLETEEVELDIPESVVDVDWLVRELTETMTRLQGAKTLLSAILEQLPETK